MDTPNAKAPERAGHTGRLVELENPPLRDPATRARQPFNWQRVLAAFVTGQSCKGFEAERALHNHCLRSTVSTLQGMDVTFHRRMEAVPSSQGCRTKVMRHWLATASRQKALTLLGRMLPYVYPCGTPVGLSDTIVGA